MLKLHLHTKFHLGIHRGDSNIKGVRHFSFTHLVSRSKEIRSRTNQKPHFNLIRENNKKEIGQSFLVPSQHKTFFTFEQHRWLVRPSAKCIMGKLGWKGLQRTSAYAIHNCSVHFSFRCIKVCACAISSLCVCAPACIFVCALGVCPLSMRAREDCARAQGDEKLSNAFF